MKREFYIACSSSLTAGSQEKVSEVILIENHIIESKARCKFLSIDGRQVSRKYLMENFDDHKKLPFCSCLSENLNRVEVKFNYPPT